MNISRIKLREIAYARSGDKGDNANIGVIAFTREGFTYLEKILTPDLVGAYFSRLGCNEVKRYTLPNLWALNFVLVGALDGGGSLSLRVDAQGKALGQALLEMEIPIPIHLLPKCVEVGNGE